VPGRRGIEPPTMAKIQSQATSLLLAACKFGIRDRACQAARVAALPTRPSQSSGHGTRPWPTSRVPANLTRFIHAWLTVLLTLATRLL
jgi:hypothetical protein